MGICNNCRWWRSVFATGPESPITGECHKNPPGNYHWEYDEKYHSFPEVMSDDWCGEFEPSSDDKEETTEVAKWINHVVDVFDGFFSEEDGEIVQIPWGELPPKVQWPGYQDLKTKIEDKCNESAD